MVRMKLQRIMIALKPWERVLPLAANHARQLAQSADAKVELVSTVFAPSRVLGHERGGSVVAAIKDRTMEAAHVELDRLAKTMRDEGQNVATKIVWGAPAYEGILSAAEEGRVDLLVVGAHEPHTLHSRLTDTDWQLMRRVTCPLLIVKRASFKGYRTILAAVDPLHAHDEPYGLDRAVLAAGRCFARAFGSALRAVYAYPGAAAFEVASAVEVAPGVFYGAENVESLHRRAVEELAAELGVGASEVDLVEGAAAAGVVNAVADRNADLVVVGATQRPGVLAAAIGSTAESVAGSVSCDVLIVPVPPAERGAATGRRSKVG
jgi:universal stress protein E